MDTELLRTFLEVRRTCHFGKAAENLCITQAAVSARIKQLEESLGAPLFLRNRNNIQLSREGERLVPHAETLLLALARARQEVSLRDSDAGHLSVGVRMGIWSEPLQQKLHGLRAAMPDLLLSVESLAMASIERQLLDRTLDLALLYEAPSFPELETIPIGTLTLRLFSASKTGSAQAALGEGYVYLDWGGGFSRFHARHFGDVPPPSLRTNLRALATSYLLEHGGACYLPRSQRGALAEAGLVPVRGAPEFSRPLNIAYHGGSPQRELIEAAARSFSGLKV